MEFSERLKSIIEERGTTMYQISKDTGIAKSTIANYLAGKTQPNQNILDKLCEHLHINKDWLTDGSGPKDITGEQTQNYSKISTLKNKEIEKNLLSIVDNLKNIFKNYEEEIEKLKKENNKLQRKETNEDEENKKS